MNSTFTIFDTVARYSRAHGLLTGKPTIILGLSGGPDSLFLLHFLANQQAAGALHLIAAHLDHGWRPDSYKDIEFCRSACQALGVPFTTAHAKEFAIQVKYEGSQEEVGRRLRRLFFEQVRQEHHADLIALAHHADDQEETFFIRLVRGSSLSGLVGMRPRAGHYIRPLLCITKHDIITYLGQHNIPYLIDPTNTHDTFLRNRIRTNVLPALKEADSRVSTTFARTLEHLQATELFLEKIAHEQYQQVVTTTQNTHYLNIRSFMTLDAVLQHRILLQWFCAYDVAFPVHHGFFNEVLRFLSSPRGGTHHAHPHWSLVKKSSTAHLQKKSS